MSPRVPLSLGPVCPSRVPLRLPRPPAPGVPPLSPLSPPCASPAPRVPSVPPVAPVSSFPVPPCPLVPPESLVSPLSPPCPPRSFHVPAVPSPPGGPSPSGSDGGGGTGGTGSQRGRGGRSGAGAARGVFRQRPPCGAGLGHEGASARPGLLQPHLLRGAQIPEAHPGGREDLRAVPRNLPEPARGRAGPRGAEIRGGQGEVAPVLPQLRGPGGGFQLRDSAAPGLTRGILGGKFHPGHQDPVPGHRDRPEQGGLQ